MRNQEGGTTVKSDPKRWGNQPRSQGLLRFQDGGWSRSRHLESGVDPGNEVVGQHVNYSMKGRGRDEDLSANTSGRWQSEISERINDEPALGLERTSVSSYPKHKHVL